MSNHATTCEPAENFDEEQSYSNIFLGHASLYALGDMWLVDSLKALAMFKLHKTLWVFELDGSNTEDFLRLARYAYREEGKGSDEGISGLRDLVCQYVASNKEVLSLDNGFMDLWGKGANLYWTCGYSRRRGYSRL